MISSQLADAVEDGRWRDVHSLVSALTPEDLLLAKRWYVKGGRSSAARYTQVYDPPADGTNRLAVVRMLAIALAPSATKTANWFQWEEWWSSGDLSANAAILQALANMGPSWCEEFCHRAVEIRLSEDFIDPGSRLVALLLPLTKHFGFEVDLSGTYVAGWAARFSTIAHYAAERTVEDPSTLSAERIRMQQPWLDHAGQVWIDDRQFDETSLDQILAEDPRLAEMVSLCISTTGIMGPFATTKRSGATGTDWDLGEALNRLTVAGTLDRRTVLDDCLAALTRRDTPSTQKAIAQVISALDPTPREVMDHGQLLQGVMAIGPGTVTAALLPLMIECLQTAADVDELAATIFGRSEKKQQTDLLRALSAPNAVDRFGKEAVVAGLQRAVLSMDLRVAEGANATLTRISPSSITEPATYSTEGLWDARPPRLTLQRLDPVEPTLDALTRLESELGVWDTITSEARMIEALLALAWRDPQGARRWLLAHVDHEWMSSDFSPVGSAVSRMNGHITVQTFSDVLTATDDPSTNTRLPWWLGRSSPSRLLSYLLQQESMLRLGETPGLLSTPTFHTGALSLDDLVRRIRDFGQLGYRQLDLFQALLRLEPIDPERANELDGLSLPATREGRLPRLPFRKHALAENDGIHIIRRWISAGGASFTEAGIEKDALTPPQTEFPIDPHALPGLPRRLRSLFESRTSADRWWHASLSEVVGTLPHWPEFHTPDLEASLDRSKMMGHAIPAIAITGRPGAGVHSVIMRALSHSDSDTRLRGVEALLTVIGRDALNRDLLTSTCLRLLASSQLALARTSSAFEQVVLGGGMSAIWPTVLAVAEAACSAPRQPAGTSALLSLVRSYGSGAPDRTVPDSIHALAARPATTKSAIEARAILAWAAPTTVRT